uniref:Glycosyltransferase family 4 protein n=1 Tax=Roseihalotalea indica TaxID=2867963 RepID=A0AA49GQ84_9BACT|nr:glycosyltransferase family 4 protein [Tunicatimonas sp. TK19036]
MSEKKRIAHFGIKYYPSQGGSSRVAELLVQQGKEHQDVTIYCYKTPDLTPEHFRSVRVIQMPSFPFGNAGVFLYYALCCLHLCLFGQYDLIHVHKTDSAFFIPFLRLKGRVLATSQEAPYRRDKWSFIGKQYFKLMERLFVYSGATLTAVSKPLTEYYQQRYGKPVNFVPNFVEVNPEYDDAEAEAILKAHGITNDYLLFSARRIMSTKGCHTMLKALQEIKYSGPVVIVGQDSHAPEYSKQLKALATGLNVTFVGYVGSKPALMSLVRKAKCFVFPSENEGMSLMLLEVASTGTPIIGSDIPENSTVFTDEEVLFFKDKSADDLAEKFQWAVQHPAEMDHKAGLAQKKVKEQYGARVVAEQYFQLYDSSVVNA